MKKITLILFFSLISFSLIIAQTLPSQTDVLNEMLIANQYFMNKWPDPATNIVTDKTRPSNLWTRGTYYEGLMQLYYITKDTSLLKYAVDWGTYHKWQPTYVGATPTRIADNQCCGQTYAELYQLDTTKTERIATMKVSVDVMVNSTKSNDWWWIDALQMAMPLFAKFGVIYRDNRYFDKLYSLYCFPRYQVKNGTGLYNTTDHLWYRDSVYLPPTKSPNGLPVYWSRGNGWVIAALVRTLDVLPVNASHRDEYLTIYKEMMAKLITIQRTDGFWNVNLGDPNDYGGKETSGTVFFTYALAWGINKGHLDSLTYYPSLAKAWNGLVNDALHSDGALGYVQSSGSKPADGQPLSYNKMANFEDFALGGLLLAGSEVYKLAKNITSDIETPDMFRDMVVFQPSESPYIVFYNIPNNTQLSIYNQTGQLLFYKKNGIETSLNLNTQKFAKGIYLVRLSSFSGKATRKFILK